MRIPTGTILTVSVLSVLSAVPLLAGCGADDGRITRTAQSAVPAAVPTGPDPLPRTASPAPDASPTGDGRRSPAPTCTPGTASPAPEPNASADAVAADAAAGRPGPADCVRATRSVPPPATQPGSSPPTTDETGPESAPEAPDGPDGGDGPALDGTAVTDAIFDSPTGVLGG